MKTIKSNAVNAQMPVNALREKHTHIYTWLCEACATMFVCTKGAANRAQKATELRNSGSRPNDNCFLALATETHMYIQKYMYRVHV